MKVFSLVLTAAVFVVLGSAPGAKADNVCGWMTQAGQQACEANAGSGCFWMPPRCQDPTGTNQFCGAVTPQGEAACNADSGVGCVWLPGTCQSTNY